MNPLNIFIYISINELLLIDQELEFKNRAFLGHRLKSNFTSKILNYLFRNDQAEANSILIHILTVLNKSEKSK